MQRYKIIMLPTQKADGGINVKGLHFKQEFYILDKTKPISAKSPFYNAILNNIQASPFNQESEEAVNSLIYAIIASTDDISLQPIPQYIIDAYIADNTIELSIDNTGNFQYNQPRFNNETGRFIDTLEETSARKAKYEALESEPQVDFDLLKDYINNNLVSSSHSPEHQAKLANVRLFFELEKVKRIINYNKTLQM